MKNRPASRPGRVRIFMGLWSLWSSIEEATTPWVCRPCFLIDENMRRDYEVEHLRPCRSINLFVRQRLLGIRTTWTATGCFGHDTSICGIRGETGFRLWPGCRSTSDVGVQALQATARGMMPRQTASVVSRVPVNLRRGGSSITGDRKWYDAPTDVVGPYGDVVSV